MLGLQFLDTALSSLFKLSPVNDRVDRINYFITPILLTFFALMVAAKQYAGAPIQCWVPSQFKNDWEQYAEDYCFMQSTYIIGLSNELDHRSDRQISYHRWIPVVLVLQAILFYLPNWLWKVLRQQSAIDLNTVVNDARRLRSFHGEDRQKEMERLSHYLNECLEITSDHRVFHKILFLQIGRGAYISILYLVIKSLYLINIIVQFFLINYFLNNRTSGANYYLWGFSFLKDLLFGNEIEESLVFPRATMCDFDIRILGNLHRHTVQCSMIINMLNEKIYLLLWFWFLLVAISTLINFIYCVVSSYTRKRTLKTFLKQDKLADIVNAPENAQILQRFANQALKPDGVLLLSFIENHAGAIVARDFCTNLFSEYVKGLDYNASQLRVPESQSKRSNSIVGEDYGHESMPLNPPNFYSEQSHPVLAKPDGAETPKHA